MQAPPTVQTPAPTGQQTASQNNVPQNNASQNTTPQTFEQLTLPSNLDPETKTFFKEALEKPETAIFVKKGIDELVETNRQKKEKENEEVQKTLKTFVEMLPNIQKMFADPYNSSLINKAHENIQKTPKDISQDTLNTAVLTVRACAYASGNLTERENQFQKELSQSLQQEYPAVKRSRLEEVARQFNSPPTFSFDPTVLNVNASAPNNTPAPQSANTPNSLMQPSRRSLQDTMREMQNSHSQYLK